MKRKQSLLFVLFFAIFHLFVYAGGGHDHDHANEIKLETEVGEKYFSVEKSSQKYELLLRYEPIKAGEHAHFTLFCSDFSTNKPLEKMIFKITSPESKDLIFEIIEQEPGVYLIETEFATNTNHSFNVSIDGPLGPDLLLLQDIKVGEELPVLESAVDELSKFNLDHWQGWAVLLGVLFLGLYLGSFYQKKRLSIGRRGATALVLVLYCTAPYQKINAHGGDDHGAGGSGNFASIFKVPKETQFLFDVVTFQLKTGVFEPSILLYGTVIPSSEGSAVVSTPQTGSISGIFVKVGQKVTKGQKLAIINPFVDVSTQVAIQGNKISQMQLEADKNILKAEVEAAQKEVNRLQTIADIAAKRDIDEAKARLDKAKNNLAVLVNHSLSSSNYGIQNSISVYAPISGILGSFILSKGSTVSVGQELFQITNLGKVYIEGQIFDRDLEQLSKNASFEAQCVNTDQHTSKVKLLALPQRINSDNQSQKVLFEMEANDDFKIGEFVNIRMFSPIQEQKNTLIVPNSAITEVNGKSVVFIKDSAEQYAISYVQTGDNNGKYTSIIKGIEENERIVIGATYQLKMIYLNQ
jgi:RND family efflux transporter MFP subunit